MFLGPLLCALQLNYFFTRKLVFFSLPISNHISDHYTSKNEVEKTLTEHFSDLLTLLLTINLAKDQFTTNFFIEKVAIQHPTYLFIYYSTIAK